jgi:AcrR family transcriptional regulator
MEAFLERLRGGASIAQAAKIAGIPRRTVYEWRDQSEDFRKAWDEAIEEGTDLLEDAARQRAVEGVQEPVFYKGEVVGYVTKHSDTLLIFLLKARRKIYREGSGDGDGVPDRLNELIAALRDK